MGCCCSKKNSPDKAHTKGELDNEEDTHVHSLMLAGDSLAESAKLQQQLSSPLEPPEPTSVTETAPFIARSTGSNSFESCRNEFSETIECSSTTVDDNHTGPLSFRRLGTVASSTWPDVSIPTATARYDHLRSVSEVDTEEDFSQVEGSTTSLQDRRLAFMAREREKTLVRVFMLTESERRRAIVDFCNTACRAMVFRHYRGILAIERRGMLIVHFTERSALLLRITVVQEAIGRRLMEHEWQARLLHEMQQHRMDRRRRVKADVQSESETTDASSVHSDEEEVRSSGAVAAAVTPTGSRPISAPGSFWRRRSQRRHRYSSLSPSAHLPPQQQQQQQQQLGSQVASVKCPARLTKSETGGCLQLGGSEVLQSQPNFGACQSMKSHSGGAEKSMKRAPLPAFADVVNGMGAPF
ncbi:hypothetical protein TraAM80_01594 [Trypanosoma rangeli]|uniref:Uncharacterized protein n=1 Tax=Trypanosoma rangeli TaxID=5698 RepID=A0A422NYB8_TRYRA|nr:uncharacterized protein TraAM80_01594 [Trypanosoma rangeli]RNF10421.1 hypothetical protein TraAM80_01594 [Trypanosoma rangeli]|eukprot:RNF10421.1 hypothetical protein TraAM80_01594 [Trypanosoma rangeli]